MSSHMARNVAVSVGAFVATLLGSLSLSSALEVFAVGRSWLGLGSPTGVALCVAGTLFAMAAAGGLVFWALANQDWHGGDEGSGGDDDEPRPPEGPGGEPVWWPRFEEDLAAYLRDRQPVRADDKRTPVPG